MNNFEISLKNALNKRKNIFSKGLFEAIEYALFNGGKRIRPNLMLYSAKALDVGYDDVIPYAMALECIHSYSLVHDDLPCMDNDTQRRGLPTVHVKYGQDIAVLAGDALLNLAYEIIFESKNINQRAASCLAKSAGMLGMVDGQAKEIELSEYFNGLDKQNQLKELLLVNSKKTGELIYASICVPCYLAGKSADICNIFGMIAKNVGKIFQIVDDILDSEKDLLQNKANIANLIGKEEAKIMAEACQKEIEESFKSLNLPNKELLEYITRLTHRLF